MPTIRNNIRTLRKLNLCNPDEISKMTVIFYGSSIFSFDKFEKIKNRTYMNKPEGGLWTSPLDSEYSWKKWCEDEDFRACEEKNSFKLKIKTNSKILKINTNSDLINLPLQNLSEEGFNGNAHIRTYIDFEKILEIGIDAIWLTENGQTETRLSYPLNLYGWDCETVLILNKDCCHEPVVRTVLFEKLKI